MSSKKGWSFDRSTSPSPFLSRLHTSTCKLFQTLPQHVNFPTKHMKKSKDSQPLVFREVSGLRQGFSNSLREVLRVCPWSSAAPCCSQATGIRSPLTCRNDSRPQPNMPSPRNQTSHQQHVTALSPSCPPTRRRSALSSLVHYGITREMLLSEGTPPWDAQVRSMSCTCEP